ncbi:hypothetical protein YC2023_066889 [Brassica napus]
MKGRHVRRLRQKTSSTEIPERLLHLYTEIPKNQKYPIRTRTGTQTPTPNATCHLSEKVFFTDVDALWSLKRILNFKRRGVVGFAERFTVLALCTFCVGTVDLIIFRYKFSDEDVHRNNQMFDTMSSVFVCQNRSWF